MPRRNDLVVVDRDAWPRGRIFTHVLILNRRRANARVFHYFGRHGLIASCAAGAFVRFFDEARPRTDRISARDESVGREHAQSGPSSTS